ncbi:MAG: hypothetical protein ABII27_09270 [bacterium]
MWEDERDLTPEERLDRVIEVLARWVLQLNELRKKSTKKNQKKDTDYLNDLT